MALNERILEKLNKVLAKANNNPSVEEAKAAMLIAQRIMVKNNLCMDDVNLADGCEVKKEVVEITVSEKKRMSRWEKRLAVVIAENFRCKCFLQHSSKIKLCLIGLKGDVVIAKETFSYALKTMNYYSSKYVRENKCSGFSTTQIKNSWSDGFIQGIKANFDKQVKQNGWGLVLVRDKVVEDAIEKLKLKKARRSVAVTGGDSLAYKSGSRQGQHFESRAGALR